MKNLLILIYLFIGAVLFGQDKTVPGNLKVNGNVTSTNITTVTNTTTTNTSDINTLNTSTTGVAGWTIGLNATLDSMVFTLGNAVYKVPIGDTVEDDVTPPTVTAIEVGNYASDTIIITTSEAMDTDSINTSFTFTEDGVTYGIGTPFFYTNDTIKIPLDSVAEAEKAYLLSYSRPGAADFQDVAGNKLATFTNTTVADNVTLSSDVYAYMLFESNDDDEMGAMTFTWYDGSEGYKTTSSPPQGTYSTNTAAGAAITTDQSHDLGDLWTFSGWFNGGNDDDTNVRYLTEIDGNGIVFDYTNDAQYLKGEIGGQAFSSSLISNATAEWQWTEFAVTYDGVGNGTNGYARTYVNGINVSSDSLVALGDDSNGTIEIAWNGTNLNFFGDYDDIHFYKAVLTDAQVLQLKNNPGVPIGGRADPPVPSDSVEVLFVEDWNDFSTTALHTATSPVGVAETALDANFTNFFVLGSEADPTIAPNIDIVSFDGSNAMKSWYLEGQCCTSIQNGFEGVLAGGTGVDVYSYINADHSTETEVYMSYNVWVYNDFENSEGYKQPGLINSLGDPHMTSRVLISDYAGYEFNLSHYTYAYYDGFSSTTRNSTSRYNQNLENGKWVNITVRTYSGTSQSSDGLVEMFIDGILIGTGLYSRPFLSTGDDALKYFNLSTFMGGGGIDFISPIDQWIIYDEVVIFQFKSGADVVRGSTPSATGRDISGTLKSISSLNFPR